MKNESEISQVILDLIPGLMKVIRKELRTATKQELTVPQLRILSHVSRGISDASSLSEIQGVSLPAISKMVDSLVHRDLVQRQFSKEDRRQAQVLLTEKGRTLYVKSQKSAQIELAKKIGRLDAKTQRSLREGLSILRETFL